VLKKILDSGTLLSSPRDNSPDAGRSWSKSGHFPLSSNQRYTTGVVCFCDIPVEDFPIHMAKYGQFGLAWSKDYMVARGASPLHYIAKSAIAMPDSPLPKDKYFDNMVRLWEEFIFSKSHSPIMNTLQGIIPQEESSRKLSEEEGVQAIRVFKEIQAYFALADFIEHHIFCFMKFFDSTLPDDHPENFYMEREWRVVGNVTFDLNSVTRVILPKEFGPKFRVDFPSYVGSVYLVP